jgi:hypothetical protein
LGKKDLTIHSVPKPTIIIISGVSLTCGKKVIRSTVVIKTLAMIIRALKNSFIFNNNRLIIF